MKNNLLEKNEICSDEAHLSLRPRFLSDFIGQSDAAENIKIFIDAALSRNEALDHILLYGPPGLGKTTLAHIISTELGSKIHMTSGPLLTKPGDLAAILTNLKKKDVLFIDEIHRLSTKIEETLYTAIEEYALDLIIGEGPSARTMRINIPCFTLIGATTRLGLISAPLRDRFGIPLKLEFYTEEELKILVQQAANKLNFAIEESAAKEIAIRSRFTPRIALRLLKRLRDFFEMSDLVIMNSEFADEMLLKLGIDKLGLDKADYDYINFIAQNYIDKPVGIETISSALSEHADNIEETVEPYLIKLGFVNKTNKGRVLTARALQYWNDIRGVLEKPPN